MVVPRVLTRVRRLIATVVIRGPQAVVLRSRRAARSYLAVVTAQATGATGRAGRTVVRGRGARP